MLDLLCFLSLGFVLFPLLAAVFSSMSHCVFLGLPRVSEVFLYGELGTTAGACMFGLAHACFLVCKGRTSV